MCMRRVQKRRDIKVIGFNLDQPEIARIEPVSYPESEIYYFEPLDEHVPVYQEKFTILQEVVMNGDARAEEVMSTMDALTLTGTLDYQACDDAICFLPSPYLFPLPLIWKCRIGSGQIASVVCAEPPITLSIN